MNAITEHSFATAVQQALTAKGWSKKRLAIFLEKNASTVSLWLAGRHRPRPDEEQTIAKLAQLLRIIGILFLPRSLNLPHPGFIIKTGEM